MPVRLPQKGWRACHRSASGVLSALRWRRRICGSIAPRARGELLQVPVTGPLGNQVMANLTLFDDGHTAVIEAAQACGLHLLPRGQRNPLHTTTSGVGEMLIAAVNAGATRLIVGIGGSSTNDGGMGCSTRWAGVSSMRKIAIYRRQALRWRKFSALSSHPISYTARLPWPVT